MSQVHPSWRLALGGVTNEIRAMEEFLRSEISAGRDYFPEEQNVLRAFGSDFNAIRVLILGQDPYPTPSHAIGLSFAVSRQTRPLPRSLQNIFRELHADLDIPTPTHGDLSAWSEQGVLLLNRVLTVDSGTPGSHRGKGWEQITEYAIRSLVQRGTPLVAILWGNDAQTAGAFLGETPILKSAHPSPLSASRGFFGSRPFSRVNECLQHAGSQPIDWCVPE